MTPQNAAPAMDTAVGIKDGAPCAPRRSEAGGHHRAWWPACLHREKEATPHRLGDRLREFQLPPKPPNLARQTVPQAGDRAWW